MRSYLQKHPWLAWLALVMVTSGVSIAISRAQKNQPSPPAPGISRQIPVALHSVVIKPGPPTPRLDTGLKDAAGNPVTAACSTCHSTTIPNASRNTASDLFQSHRGLQYAHGNLTCLSCHNAANYDTLHLADGRGLDFPEVITLCSQCHGSQKRDYDHGSHGGMNGHWDLTKGGRLRNNCINCHDPHRPAYPLVQPVLSPRDRISVPKNAASP